MNTNIDRIYIAIMALGYLMASLFLVITAIGWTTPLNTLVGYLLYTTNRWVLGITGTFIFVIALTLFFSSFRSKPDRISAVHETTLGQIKITIHALEHLVLKAAKSIHGIREVKPLLKSLKSGLVIELRVQVLPDVNIPEVTEELQKTVREYLQKTAGIGVQEIRVLVNRVSWEVKNRVE